MRAATIVLVATAFICMVGATIVSARAATVCASHEQVVKYLSRTHSEVAVYMGLTGSGHVLEVFVSPKGTWTILVTRPNGRACVTAFGEAWEPLAPAPVIEGEPT